MKASFWQPKQRLKQSAKRYVKTLMTWTGFDVLQSGGRFIHGAVKGLFPKNGEVGQSDSFEQALQHYGLNEQDLQDKQRHLRRSCGFYLIVAIAVFFYGCVLLSRAHWYAFMASSLMSLMLFSFAFKAHFWLQQIRLRRLGLSWQEWWAMLVRGQV